MIKIQLQVCFHEETLKFHLIFLAFSLINLSAAHFLTKPKWQTFRVLTKLKHDVSTCMFDHFWFYKPEFPMQAINYYRANPLALEGLFPQISHVKKCPAFQRAEMSVPG